MIPQSRLDRGFIRYQAEYEEKVLNVLRSGWYVLGQEVEGFEKEFALFTGAKYCVGVASGLDALQLAFRVLDISKGDEVIVQGNTYIASVMGITMNGATPIFVEPNEYDLMDETKVEEAITDRTKAILVVHLYGQASNMSALCEIASRYGLKVIEDCAQSHGAAWNGKQTGTFGDIGCFSFYPSKNLGAFGDGGAIITDNEAIAEEMKVLRNYGSERRYYNRVIGYNSRLDEIQAGLLRVKLTHLQELTEERNAIAQKYLAAINNPLIWLPKVREGATHVWHQFVVHCERRDELMQYLQTKGVGTIIHYPVPPHLQKGYSYLQHKEGDFPITEKYAKEVLSLPLFTGMIDEETKEVIDIINRFSR